MNRKQRENKRKAQAKKQASSGGSSSNNNIQTGTGVTEVSPGLYKYRDPKTGKLSYTSSKEFADTSSVSGTPTFTQEFQKKYRSGSRSGSGTSQAFVREAAARAAATTAEKQRIAQATKAAELKREQQKINNLRQRLETQNAIRKSEVFRDKKTGHQVKYQTLINLRTNERIFTTTDLKTGDVETRTYERVGKSRNTFQTGGIKTSGSGKPTASDIASRVKITSSSNPNKVIVTFPNGQTGTINARGKVVVGARLAGHKYLFENGVIIAVDGKTTFARDEFVIPAGEVQAAEKKGSLVKGYQKLKGFPERFKSKEVKEEQAAKEKPWKVLFDKMSKGQKLNQNDIISYKELARITPEKIVDKDIAKLAQITGGTIGTVVAPIPGAIMWAMGDTMESVRMVSADGKKVSKSEFGKIVLDSATKGAILGFSMKLLGGLGSISSKRILLSGALQRAESNAVRAAVNHGGILIKLVGRSGKNFISTYFMKDMIGNVFDVTADVKAGRLNNALRKAIETTAAVGGYIGGSVVGKATTKGTLFVSGRLKGTSPEFAQKKIPADVMAKQLLSEGKIVLSRRGVYESGKGLSPRKDAWLDSKVKNPTKSIFWRFDKTLGKKGDVISPLPLFTKSKTGYFKMFKANWNKNKGMTPVKRYIKTTAETPLVEDVLIRKVVNLKTIKNQALKNQVIKEYATKGKLSKATQDKILKNPKYGISDKNREFGFHDENEFVTRTGFKLKGRKDISWTHDPTINEYVPVVQSLKDAGKIRNFLSILNKKNIITRTDAKFIQDNYAIKKKFGLSSILPKQHSMQHMRNVESNIVKLMTKYPEFNKYWIKKYGSIAKAKSALKEAMWHDIGKAESSSVAFGTPHGEKVWNVWKKGLLPKGIKLNKAVAKGIKKHETLDPRKLWYKVQNKAKLITPEEKIIATADRLDLNRVGIKIDLARLPLRDAVKRLGLNIKVGNYPSKFNSIIARIKIDKGVTRADLKKLSDFIKSKGKLSIVPKKSPIKYKGKKSIQSYKAGLSAGRRAGSKAPKNYNPNHKGDRKAYVDGYRQGYSGRYLIDYRTGKYKPSKRVPIRRPIRRTPIRPTKRPTPRRPAKRPPKKTPRRPIPRSPRRPPKRPTKKPPIIPIRLPIGFTKKKVSKPQPVFYIKVKSKGRIVNLTPRPLIMKDAKDFLAHKLDKNLVRTAYFEPIGMAKNVVRIPTRMRGYFTKNKHKLRPYKIKVGKKKQLRMGYIEKKKYIGDTTSELRALKKARAGAKRKRKIVKRRKAK